MAVARVAETPQTLLAPTQAYQHQAEVAHLADSEILAVVHIASVTRVRDLRTELIHRIIIRTLLPTRIQSIFQTTITRTPLAAAQLHLEIPMAVQVPVLEMRQIPQIPLQAHN